MLDITQIAEITQSGLGNLTYLLYLVLFLWWIKISKFFDFGRVSRWWLIGVFATKVVASFALFWVYTNYYTNRASADIFKFYDDSQILYSALLNKPIDYVQMITGIGAEASDSYFYETYYSKMNHWIRILGPLVYNDNRMMIRLNAIFSVFSFGNYHTHALFMTMFSFVGLSMIFRALKHWIDKRLWLIGILLFQLMPSMLLWSSGILKEALVLLALGVFILQLFRISENPKQVWRLLFLFPSIAALCYIKFYIGLALIPGLIAFLWIRLTKSKNPTIKFTIICVVCGLIAFLGKTPNGGSLTGIMMHKQKDFIGMVKYQDAGSQVTIEALDDNFLSYLTTAPQALFNVFLEPLPTTSNPLFLLAAFENLAIILLIVIGIIFKQRIDSKNYSVILWFSSFVLFLFLIIGWTTPVAGSIVRYKIPAFPFLLATLLMVIDVDRIWHKVPKKYQFGRLNSA